MADGIDNTTAYFYDSAGRLTETVYPDGGRVTMTHNAAGLVTARTDQNGVTAELDYDDLNLLIGVEFVQGAAALYKHEYGYNRSGRLLMAKRIQDSATTAEWAFLYDALGRRTEQVQQIAGLAGTYTTEFTYIIDATSTATMTYPSGRTVTHSYDLRFRPIGVSSIKAGTQAIDVLGSWTFDIANRPMTADIGNATTADILTTAFGFDALDRLTQVKHDKSGAPATTLFHENYAYDDVGNRLSTEKVHDSGNGEVYQYDNRDRLIAFQRGTLNQAVSPPTVDTPTSSSLLNKSQSWDLDANGNWTSTTTERPSGTITEARQVNAVNEYTKIGYVPTNHDANGNMLFDGQRAYTYDAQNRVTSIYNVCSQGITEFAYGPLGEQITEARNGVTTYHIYVGTDVIAEYAANGDRLREYLDGPAGKLAMVDWTSAGAVAAGSPEVVFYLVGHLGSVVALTDTNGNVVERYAYEPYGQTIITDGSGSVERAASAYGNPHMWTGQRYDADNQLYHFYFRTYSPHLGRWLHRDPLGYVDGLNHYQYVSGHPLSFVDRTGAVGDLEVDGILNWDSDKTGHVLINFLDDGGYWDFAQFVSGFGLDFIRDNALRGGHASKDLVWVTLGSERYLVEPQALRRWVEQELNEDVGGLSVAEEGFSPEFLQHLISESFANRVSVAGIMDVASGQMILDPDDPEVIREFRQLTLEMGKGVVLAEIKAGLQEYVNAGKQMMLASVLHTAIGILKAKQGGVYVLRDPETGQVMRSGRSGDLMQRRAQHRRHPVTRDLKFEVVYKTNDYAQQRGLEQVVHDKYKPPLNRINPVQPKKRQQYLDPVRKFFEANEGCE